MYACSESSRSKLLLRLVVCCIEEDATSIHRTAKLYKIWKNYKLYNSVQNLFIVDGIISKEEYFQIYKEYFDHNSFFIYIYFFFTYECREESNTQGHILFLCSILAYSTVFNFKNNSPTNYKIKPLKNFCCHKYFFFFAFLQRLLLFCLIN